MPTSHELYTSTPEMLHGIDFINFLENINKKAFDQKGEIKESERRGVQKYDFDLRGQTIISIQSDEDKIMVESGINNKYSVVIDPNFKPLRTNAGNQNYSLDLEYVLRSVIVEGLFPGRKNKDRKAEMYKAISDTTNGNTFTFEIPQAEPCNIKMTVFKFGGK